MVSSCHNCGPPSSCTWGQKWGRSVVPFTKIYSFPSIILPPQQKLIAAIAFSFPISTKTSQNINFRFFSKFSTPPTNPEKSINFHGSMAVPAIQAFIICLGAICAAHSALKALRRSQNSPSLSPAKCCKAVTTYGDRHAARRWEILEANGDLNRKTWENPWGRHLYMVGLPLPMKAKNRSGNGRELYDFILFLFSGLPHYCQ